MHALRCVSYQVKRFLLIAGAAPIVLGLSTLCPSAARAQSAPAEGPTGARLVPPRAVDAPVAPYPPSGKGDAVVLLRVRVSEDGAVASATVDEGEAPFADAATRAVLQWRFAPATRDGRPVAAFVRIEVRFAAAAPTPPEEPPQPAVAVPVAPVHPAPAAPAEVVVTGDRAPPGAASVSRSEARQLPGAFGDPFRAVESLPGVTPVVSGLPHFFIRGAPPGNAAYFLDGIRVPFLFHAGLGPAVVHPALVDRVDVHPGPYPARYGGVTGGVVAGETRRDERRLHGEAGVRLVDASALAEAPILGGRGAALAGGRYSFAGPVLSLFAKDTSLSYWDYQARVAVDVGRDDRISVFAFGSSDYLATREDDREVPVIDTRFHRLDLRYDHVGTDGTQVRYAVTLGHDHTRGDTGYASRLGADSGTSSDVREVTTRSIATRVEAAVPAGEHVTLRGGARAGLDDYDVADTGAEAGGQSPEGSYLSSTIRSRTDLAIDAWTDASLRPSRKLEVVPGLRAALYASDGATAVAVEPRLSARFQVSPRVALLHALGVAYQPPTFVAALPGFQIAGLRRGLQRAVQASYGVEVLLASRTTATATVYRQMFSNMSDALGNRSSSLSGYERRAEARSEGVATGLELSVRRSLTQALGGIVSYTLSTSTRRVGNDTFPSAYDRRHVLSAALSHALGRGVRAGARAVYYTGSPVSDKGVDPLGRPYQVPDRLPAFGRIDTRVEKRWPMADGGHVSLVLEVQNVTLAKETVDYDCDPEGCRPKTVGPVTIPSVGVEAAF